MLEAAAVEPGPEAEPVLEPAAVEPGPEAEPVLEAAAAEPGPEAEPVLEAAAVEPELEAEPVLEPAAAALEAEPPLVEPELDAPPEEEPPGATTVLDAAVEEDDDPEEDPPEPAPQAPIAIAQPTSRGRSQPRRRSERPWSRLFSLQDPSIRPTPTDMARSPFPLARSPGHRPRTGFGGAVARPADASGLRSPLSVPAMKNR